MRNRQTRLAYALGGGLGHLTRVLKAYDKIGQNRPLTIMVSPQVADWKPFPLPDKVALEILPKEYSHDPKATSEWIKQHIAELAPDEFWVDAFPIGIFGELVGLQKELDSLAMKHFARILKPPKPDFFASTIDLNYETIYVVERIGSAHRDFLNRISDQVQEIELAESPCDPKTDLENYHLLTHSGDQQEVDQLVSHLAIETGDRVIAAVGKDIRLPNDFVRVTSARPYYKHAKMIVSGAGFNTIHETRNYRDKQIAIAFPRRFDDQALRCQHEKVRVVCSPLKQ